MLVVMLVVVIFIISAYSFINFLQKRAIMSISTGIDICINNACWGQEAPLQCGARRPRERLAPQRGRLAPT